LREVLQRTGFSRSTLYSKIAKNEFPHQVSLGDRAVGWLKREVDSWISERIRLRPNWATEISDDFEEALTAQSRRVNFSDQLNRRFEWSL
jgi:prophage regulatory protein